MLRLDNRYDEFRNLDTLPLGISIDSVSVKEAWAEELDLEQLQLVADFWPHGELAQELDVFRDEDGFSERANILLNEDGEVVWTKVYELGEVPDLDEVIEVIEQQ